MMAKSCWRHYDINNLTLTLQKEGRVEWNNGLEVVTDGKPNDKTAEKND